MYVQPAVNIHNKNKKRANVNVLPGIPINKYYGKRNITFHLK